MVVVSSLQHQPHQQQQRLHCFPSWFLLPILFIFFIILLPITESALSDALTIGNFTIHSTPQLHHVLDHLPPLFYLPTQRDLSISLQQWANDTKLDSNTTHSYREQQTMTIRDARFVETFHLQNTTIIPAYISSPNPLNCSVSIEIGNLSTILQAARVDGYDDSIKFIQVSNHTTIYYNSIHHSSSSDDLGDNSASTSRLWPDNIDQNGISSDNGSGNDSGDSGDSGSGDISAVSYENKLTVTVTLDMYWSVQLAESTVASHLFQTSLVIPVFSQIVNAPSLSELRSRLLNQTLPDSAQYTSWFQPKLPNIAAFARVLLVPHRTDMYPHIMAQRPTWNETDAKIPTQDAQNDLDYQYVPPSVNQILLQPPLDIDPTEKKIDLTPTPHDNNTNITSSNHTNNHFSFSLPQHTLVSTRFIINPHYLYSRQCSVFHFHNQTCHLSSRNHNIAMCREYGGVYDAQSSKCHCPIHRTGQFCQSDAIQYNFWLKTPEVPITVQQNRHRSDPFQQIDRTTPLNVHNRSESPTAHNNQSHSRNHSDESGPQPYNLHDPPTYNTDYHIYALPTQLRSLLELSASRELYRRLYNLIDDAFRRRSVCSEDYVAMGSDGSDGSEFDGLQIYLEHSNDNSGSTDMKKPRSPSHPQEIAWPKPTHYIPFTAHGFRSILFPGGIESATIVEFTSRVDREVGGGGGSHGRNHGLSSADETITKQSETFASNGVSTWIELGGCSEFSKYVEIMQYRQEVEARLAHYNRTVEKMMGGNFNDSLGTNDKHNRTGRQNDDAVPIADLQPTDNVHNLYERGDYTPLHDDQIQSRLNRIAFNHPQTQHWVRLWGAKLDIDQTNGEVDGDGIRNRDGDFPDKSTVAPKKKNPQKRLRPPSVCRPVNDLISNPKAEPERVTANLVPNINTDEVVSTFLQQFRSATTSVLLSRLVSQLTMCPASITTIMTELMISRQNDEPEIPNRLNVGRNSGLDGGTNETTKNSSQNHNEGYPMGNDDHVTTPTPLRDTTNPYDYLNQTFPFWNLDQVPISPIQHERDQMSQDHSAFDNHQQDLLALMPQNVNKQVGSDPNSTSNNNDQINHRPFRHSPFFSVHNPAHPALPLSPLPSSSPSPPSLPLTPLQSLTIFPILLYWTPHTILQSPNSINTPENLRVDHIRTKYGVIKREPEKYRHLLTSEQFQLSYISEYGRDYYITARYPLNTASGKSATTELLKSKQDNHWVSGWNNLLAIQASQNRFLEIHQKRKLAVLNYYNVTADDLGQMLAYSNYYATFDADSVGGEDHHSAIPDSKNPTTSSPTSSSSSTSAHAFSSNNPFARENIYGSVTMLHYEPVLHTNPTRTFDLALPTYLINNLLHDYELTTRVQPADRIPITPSKLDPKARTNNWQNSRPGSRKSLPIPSQPLPPPIKSQHIPMFLTSRALGYLPYAPSMENNIQLLMKATTNANLYTTPIPIATDTTHCDKEITNPLHCTKLYRCQCVCRIGRVGANCQQRQYRSYYFSFVHEDPVELVGVGGSTPNLLLLYLNSIISLNNISPESFTLTQIGQIKEDGTIYTPRPDEDANNIYYDMISRQKRLFEQQRRAEIEINIGPDFNTTESNSAIPNPDATIPDLDPYRDVPVITNTININSRLPYVPIVHAQHRTDSTGLDFDIVLAKDYPPDLVKWPTSVTSGANGAHGEVDGGFSQDVVESNEQNDLKDVGAEINHHPTLNKTSIKNKDVKSQLPQTSPQNHPTHQQNTKPPHLSNIYRAVFRLDLSQRGFIALYQSMIRSTSSTTRDPRQNQPNGFYHTISDQVQQSTIPTASPTNSQQGGPNTKNQATNNIDQDSSNEPSAKLTDEQKRTQQRSRRPVTIQSYTQHQELPYLDRPWGFSPISYLSGDALSPLFQRHLGAISGGHLSSPLSPFFPNNSDASSDSGAEGLNIARTKQLYERLDDGTICGVGPDNKWSWARFEQCSVSPQSKSSPFYRPENMATTFDSEGDKKKNPGLIPHHQYPSSTITNGHQSDNDTPTTNHGMYSQPNNPSSQQTTNDPSIERQRLSPSTTYIQDKFEQEALLFSNHLNHIWYRQYLAGVNDIVSFRSNGEIWISIRETLSTRIRLQFSYFTPSPWNYEQAQYILGESKDISIRDEFQDAWLPRDKGLKISKQQGLVDGGYRVQTFDTLNDSNELSTSSSISRDLSPSVHNAQRPISISHPAHNITTPQPPNTATAVHRSPKPLPQIFPPPSGQKMHFWLCKAGNEWVLCNSHAFVGCPLMLEQFLHGEADEIKKQHTKKRAKLPQQEEYQLREELQSQHKPKQTKEEISTFSSHFTSASTFNNDDDGDSTIIIDDENEANNGSELKTKDSHTNDDADSDEMFSLNNFQATEHRWEHISSLPTSGTNTQSQNHTKHKLNQPEILSQTEAPHSQTDPPSTSTSFVNHSQSYSLLYDPSQPLEVRRSAHCVNLDFVVSNNPQRDCPAPKPIPFSKCSRFVRWTCSLSKRIPSMTRIHIAEAFSPQRFFDDVNNQPANPNFDRNKVDMGDNLYYGQVEQRHNTCDLLSYPFTREDISLLCRGRCPCIINPGKTVCNLHWYEVEDEVCQQFSKPKPRPELSKIFLEHCTISGKIGKPVYNIQKQELSFEYMPRKAFTYDPHTVAIHSDQQSTKDSGPVFDGLFLLPFSLAVLETWIQTRILVLPIPNLPSGTYTITILPYNTSTFSPVVLNSSSLLQVRGVQIVSNCRLINCGQDDFFFNSTNIQLPSHYVPNTYGDPNVPNDSIYSPLYRNSFNIAGYLWQDVLELSKHALTPASNFRYATLLFSTDNFSKTITPILPRRGLCNPITQACDCSPGWYGSRCEYRACLSPLCLTYTSKCNNNGMPIVHPLTGHVSCSCRPPYSSSAEEPEFIDRRRDLLSKLYATDEEHLGDFDNSLHNSGSHGRDDNKNNNQQQQQHQRKEKSRQSNPNTEPPLKPRSSPDFHPNSKASHPNTRVHSLLPEILGSYCDTCTLKCPTGFLPAPGCSHCREESISVAKRSFISLIYPSWPDIENVVSEYKRRFPMQAQNPYNNFPTTVQALVGRTFESFARLLLNLPSFVEVRLEPISWSALQNLFTIDNRSGYYSRDYNTTSHNIWPKKAHPFQHLIDAFNANRTSNRIYNTTNEAYNRAQETYWYYENQRAQSAAEAFGESNDLDNDPNSSSSAQNGRFNEESIGNIETGVRLIVVFPPNSYRHWTTQIRTKIDYQSDTFSGTWLHNNTYFDYLFHLDLAPYDNSTDLSDHLLRADLSSRSSPGSSSNDNNNNNNNNNNNYKNRTHDKIWNNYRTQLTPSSLYGDDPSRFRLLGLKLFQFNLNNGYPLPESLIQSFNKQKHLLDEAEEAFRKKQHDINPYSLNYNANGNTTSVSSSLSTANMGDKEGYFPLPQSPTSRTKELQQYLSYQTNSDNYQGADAAYFFLNVDSEYFSSSIYTRLINALLHASPFSIRAEQSHFHSELAKDGNKGESAVVIGNNSTKTTPIIAPDNNVHMLPDHIKNRPKTNIFDYIRSIRDYLAKSLAIPVHLRSSDSLMSFDPDDPNMITMPLALAAITKVNQVFGEDVFTKAIHFFKVANIQSFMYSTGLVIAVNSPFFDRLFERRDEFKSAIHGGQHLSPEITQIIDMILRLIPKSARLLCMPDINTDPCRVAIFSAIPDLSKLFSPHLNVQSDDAEPSNQSRSVPDSTLSSNSNDKLSFSALTIKPWKPGMSRFTQSAITVNSQRHLELIYTTDPISICNSQFTNQNSACSMHLNSNKPNNNVFCGPPFYQTGVTAGCYLKGFEFRCTPHFPSIFPNLIQYCIPGCDSTDTTPIACSIMIQQQPGSFDNDLDRLVLNRLASGGDPQKSLSDFRKRFDQQKQPNLGIISAPLARNHSVNTPSNYPQNSSSSTNSTYSELIPQSAAAAALQIDDIIWSPNTTNHFGTLIANLMPIPMIDPFPKALFDQSWPQSPSPNFTPKLDGNSASAHNNTLSHHCSYRTLTLEQIYTLSRLVPPITNIVILNNILAPGDLISLQWSYNLPPLQSQLVISISIHSTEWERAVFLGMVDPWKNSALLLLPRALTPTTKGYLIFDLQVFAQYDPSPTAKYTNINLYSSTTLRTHHIVIFSNPFACGTTSGCGVNFECDAIRRLCICKQGYFVPNSPYFNRHYRYGGLSPSSAELFTQPASTWTGGYLYDNNVNMNADQEISHFNHLNQHNAYYNQDISHYVHSGGQGAHFDWIKPSSRNSNTPSWQQLRLPSSQTAHFKQADSLSMPSPLPRELSGQTSYSLGGHIRFGTPEFEIPPHSHLDQPHIAPYTILDDGSFDIFQMRSMGPPAKCDPICGGECFIDPDSESECDPTLPKRCLCTKLQIIDLYKDDSYIKHWYAFVMTNPYQIEQLDQWLVEQSRIGKNDFPSSKEKNYQQPNTIRYKPSSNINPSFDTVKIPEFPPHTFLRSIPITAPCYPSSSICVYECIHGRKHSLIVDYKLQALHQKSTSESLEEISLLYRPSLLSEICSNNRIYPCQCLNRWIAHPVTLQCSICSIRQDDCDDHGTDWNQTLIHCTKCKCKLAYTGLRCQTKVYYSSISLFGLEDLLAAPRLRENYINALARQMEDDPTDAAAHEPQIHGGHLNLNKTQDHQNQGDTNTDLSDIMNHTLTSLRVTDMNGYDNCGDDFGGDDDDLIRELCTFRQLNLGNDDTPSILSNFSTGERYIASNSNIKSENSRNDKGTGTTLTTTTTTTNSSSDPDSEHFLKLKHQFIDITRASIFAQSLLQTGGTLTTLLAALHKAYIRSITKHPFLSLPVPFTNHLNDTPNHLPPPTQIDVPMVYRWSSILKSQEGFIDPRLPPLLAPSTPALDMFQPFYSIFTPTLTSQTLLPVCHCTNQTFVDLVTQTVKDFDQNGQHPEYTCGDILKSTERLAQMAKQYHADLVDLRRIMSLPLHIHGNGADINMWANSHEPDNIIVQIPDVNHEGYAEVLKRWSTLSIGINYPFLVPNSWSMRFASVSIFDPRLYSTICDDLNGGQPYEFPEKPDVCDVENLQRLRSSSDSPESNTIINHHSARNLNAVTKTNSYGLPLNQDHDTTYLSNSVIGPGGSGGAGHHVLKSAIQTNQPSTQRPRCFPQSIFNSLSPPKRYEIIYHQNALEISQQSVIPWIIIAAVLTAIFFFIILLPISYHSRKDSPIWYELVYQSTKITSCTCHHPKLVPLPSLNPVPKPSPPPLPSYHYYPTSPNLIHASRSSIFPHPPTTISAQYPNPLSRPGSNDPTITPHLSAFPIHSPPSSISHSQTNRPIRPTYPRTWCCLAWNRYIQNQLDKSPNEKHHVEILPPDLPPPPPSPLPHVLLHPNLANLAGVHAFQPQWQPSLLDDQGGHDVDEDLGPKIVSPRTLNDTNYYQNSSLINNSLAEGRSPPQFQSPTILRPLNSQHHHHHNGLSTKYYNSTGRANHRLLDYPPESSNDARTNNESYHYGDSLTDP